MNSWIAKLFSGTNMRVSLFRLLMLGITAYFLGWRIADAQRSAPDLTVHEWGTFTAVAGNDGRAVEWTPLTWPADLPGFVEHFSDVNFKVGLRGTIRMETPVLYFYSPRDLNLSVKVAFSKGLITEWYPHAVRVLPEGVLRNTNLSQLQTDGSIVWNNVTVSPNLSGEFPRESRKSRYYAARETSSTPLRVKTNAGDQQERFLFYRGVSAAALPVLARQTGADGRLMVKTLSAAEIPAAILFERRGERVGYRVERWLTDETILEPPPLTDNADSLFSDLEGILIEQGLYPDEAHAMVETWKDSWLEEGSRLIYIVPRGFIDQVLPLTINPVPEQVVRVFVGRLEIVTPATIRSVETALASKDDATLEKYRRFLEPIHGIAMQEHAGSSQ